VKTESAQAAPLESFPNSPCHYYAQHIQPGVVVEVLNPDGQGNLKNDSNAYWFAEIRERYGLKIKVSYIGCRGKLELWLNATDVYPVGFCISENKKQLAKMNRTNPSFWRETGFGDPSTWFLIFCMCMFYFFFFLHVSLNFSFFVHLSPVSTVHWTIKN